MKTERENKITFFVDRVHEGQMWGGREYRFHRELVAAELAAAGLDSESDRIIADAHDAIEDAKDEDHRKEVI